MNEMSTTPGAIPPDPDSLMTFAEGCDFVKMSPRWMADHLNEIPHIRLGRNIRFRRLALISWCEQQERGGKET
jgi:predicted YcjX-like family ATPase